MRPPSTCLKVFRPLRRRQVKRHVTSMTRVSAVQFIKEEWFNLLEGFRRRRDFSLESFRNLYSSISMSFGENVGSLLRFAPIPSLNAHEATVQLDTSCRSWLLLPSRYQRQNF